VGLEIEVPVSETARLGFRVLDEATAEPLALAGRQDRDGNL
jgi:hypothetical protein